MIPLRNTLLIVVAFLSLMWPLSINGGLYLFPDSGAYLQGAATGFEHTFGVQSHLSEPWRLPQTALTTGTPDSTAETPITAQGAPESTATKDGPSQDPSISAARSPYFGAVAFLSTNALGHIGFPLFSAAVVLGVILMASQLITGGVATGALATITVSVLTPLPFFACFLMPDVFTGIVILSSALLFAYRKQSGRISMIALGAIIIMGTMFHTSHILLIWSLALIGTPVALLLSGRLPLAALIVTVLATLATLTGGQVFNSLVERAYGVEPISPPFLVARLVADGPGYRYLKETCGTQQSIFCKYLDRMPGTYIDDGSAEWYSDGFLWSYDERFGVFSVAPIEDRRLMSTEHFRFAAAVFTYAPAEVLTNSVANGMVQLFLRTQLGEFTAQSSYTSLYNLIGEGVFEKALSPATHDRLIGALQRAYPPITWGAFAICIAGWLACRRRLPPDQGEALGILLLVMAAGFVANAMILGGLSAPHGRYQARIFWLPVLGCALLLSSHRQGKLPKAICKTIGEEKQPG